MSDPPEEDFEKARNDALALVERAIAFLRTKRDERLASAEIDPVRLRVGSSRVDLQACKLEYSIVSPK